MSKAIGFTLLGLALSAVAALFGGDESFDVQAAIAAEAPRPDETPRSMIGSEADVPKDPGRDGPTLVGRAPKSKPMSDAEYAQKLVEQYTKQIHVTKAAPTFGALITSETLLALEDVLEKMKLEPWQREAIDRLLEYARRDMERLKDLRNVDGESWNDLMAARKRAARARDVKASLRATIRLAQFPKSRLYRDGETMNDQAERVFEDTKRRIEDLLYEKQLQVWSEHDARSLLSDLTFEKPRPSWSRVQVTSCYIDKLVHAKDNHVRQDA